MQFWTRNVRKPEPTKPVKFTVWRDLTTSTRLLPEFQGHSVLERIQFHDQKERSGSRVWDGPGGSGQTGEVVEADDDVDDGACVREGGVRAPSSTSSTSSATGPEDPNTKHQHGAEGVDDGACFRVWCFTETRNPKPGTRNPKHQNSKLGSRNPKPELRNVGDGG